MCGNHIQKIMYEKRLTYRQLSFLTGVSKSALQKIANGENSPTQKIMVQIAKGLNMKVQDLFDLDY